ncbi:LysR family transcriptional regulator [Facklamia miroungae]|uniref:DNA-binding transcriptional regulator, LysR family n=1 Tax=Facklamia miroungae TaxID=120956 RepID=A0A1G7PHJ7_9LACT|nr:LysR family transcriptional regulator [Facklamia miroungae]NKZ28709.1 LysR family transcriptional regulator [Facklamia miroungae]SDF85574.1 DNA-binding transcriptional regulator, LysR family [Facklamia miroungae]
MDINHIKYILEIAKTGSISRASQNLFVSQPYLSSILKKFEETIGFTIFERTNKGVELTKEGLQIIQDIEKLNDLYEGIANKYQSTHSHFPSLSISARRSSYIAFAIAKMINRLQEENDNLSIKFSETTNLQVIEDVNSGNADIGIIRFYTENKNHFENQLKARYIEWKQLSSFPRVVLIAQQHPLAKKEHLELKDLEPYTEIIHGDFELDDYSEAYLWQKKINSSKKLIQVYERGSLLDFIATIEGSYTWTTATYPTILDKYNLIEKSVLPSHSECLDYIIYKAKLEKSVILRLVEEKIYETIQLFNR